MSTRAELPPRRAQLKDGRSVELRHACPGDEAGIARLLVDAFPVYRRAARGDLERAARRLAAELAPESFVVAALVEGGAIVGVSCVGGRGPGLGAVARLRRKLVGWGVHGLGCFGLEKLRSRLLESRHAIGRGELYRYLDAVDGRCRSLGVGRHVADFVEDYARASGHHTVSALHRADNAPVLALHRQRGCSLVTLPPTRLARLLRLPTMVVSTRALSALTPGAR